MNYAISAVDRDSNNFVERDVLKACLDDLLKPEQFDDYGPNGLQIEGRKEIRKVAFAVSATVDSIERVVEWGGDALIVHHGIFWNFHGVRPLTGTFARRTFPLVRGEVNLFGYHLPLDAHPRVGNAATLARRLGMTSLEPYGPQKRGPPCGVWGVLPTSESPLELSRRLEELLGHPVLSGIPDGVGELGTLAIITGGANGDWVHCVDAGVDAYLTGEMSEHDWHESREAGICLFAGGHHATERFGVCALKELLGKKFSLETLFIDSPNPA